jgi:hypothetical protein
MIASCLPNPLIVIDHHPLKLTATLGQLSQPDFGDGVPAPRLHPELTATSGQLSQPDFGDGVPAPRLHPELALTSGQLSQPDFGNGVPRLRGQQRQDHVFCWVHTMHISSDNISPPYHHIHARKSSSPIPAHTKTQITIDTKHTSPKENSSAHQHTTPTKLNTVYTFARTFTLSRRDRGDCGTSRTTANQPPVYSAPVRTRARAAAEAQGNLSAIASTVILPPPPKKRKREVADDTPRSAKKPITNSAGLLN